MTASNTFGQARFAENNALLNQRFARNKVLICAHRGSWHGNIIQNTTLAYKAALMQGADIVETDTSMSYDGEVFSMHDGVEWRLLGRNRKAQYLTADQIAHGQTLNALGEPSSHCVQRLEEVLAYLCHGELLNVDRVWRAGDKVLPILDRFPHMAQQAIVKAPLKERQILEQLNEHPVKYMFMPICYNLAEVEAALQYKDVNMVGVELIASSTADELYQDDSIAYMHSKGLFCWANALTLTDVPLYLPLYGDLDDDRSIAEAPANGWGRMMDKGIDVIQTDWPALVKNYRAERFSL